MKRLQILTILTLSVFLGACAQNAIPGANGFSSKDVWLTSRGQRIPATWVTPTKNQTMPLVLLIHGHGGTRHEAGGFTRVAEGLARQGIASIRMDFPGCGDSEEPFSKNNLSNMLLDVKAAQSYALKSGNIDTTRIGLVGFSMGGRLAMLLTQEGGDYAALAMWAPSAVNGAGDMVKYLGGPAKYESMKNQAKTEGFAPYTTFWGQKQQLGLQWFLDMENSRPLDAVQEFKGDIFVLYGDKDVVIPPRVSELVLTNAKNADIVKRYVVVGADHGLGLFNDDHNSSRQAVDETVRFLVGSLGGGAASL
ncbi:MAG: alpha/beta fold hydrolase [Pseudomonadota bacterium]